MSLLSKKYEYVYLLEEIGENGQPTDYVKIGHTTNTPSIRAAQLSTGNARQLKPYAAIRTEIGESFNREQILHRWFQRHNTHDKMHGGLEWFDDSKLEIKDYFDKHTDKLSANEFIDFKNWMLKVHDFSSGPYKDTWSFCETQIAPFLHNEHVLVLAPPKSGKRIMVQSLALLMSDAMHIYLTSLDKTDMNVQLLEYDDYNITAISVTNTGKETVATKKNLLESISKWHGMVIIHFDECDYGSASEGKFTEFVKGKKGKGGIVQCISPDSQLRYVVYSATPEEALFSGAKYHLAHFTPSTSYNGPKWFLDNDLVTDPEPFFNFDGTELVLTKQADEILSGQLLSDKFCSVVRFNYKLGKESAFQIAKENKRLQKVIDSKYGAGKFVVHFYDQKNSFEWCFYDDKKDSLGDWAKFSSVKKHLLIINGICTRGTEVGFHPMIYAWHDYRKAEPSTTTYGTYAQAMGRLFHYSPDYEKTDRKMKFGTLDTKVKLYVEKSLCKVMSDVYSSNTMDDMKNIWEGYKARNLGSRTTQEESDIWEYIAFDKKEDAQEVFKKSLQDEGRYDEVKWINQWKAVNHCKSFESENLIDRLIKGRLPPDRASRIIHLDAPCPKWPDDFNNYIKQHPEHLGKFMLAIKSTKHFDIKSKETFHNVL